jgi:hypothetical protein
MAQLMICPGCKSDIPAGEQYCQTCFLTPVPKPSDEPAAEAESAAPPHSDRPTTPGACPDPDCVHAGSPPAAGCRHCGLAGAAAATTLRFAWGPVTVSTDRPLVVGRENSPIADRLGDYSNISRRHAEIRSDGTGLTVVDLDSMNGTFLNDERLPAGQATPIRAGDRVRFAARLEATVTGETA